jgi:hypothetical protein
MTVIRYEPWALGSRRQKDIARLRPRCGASSASRQDSSAAAACRSRRIGSTKAVNGVLEVSIPKLAQVQPHRITVAAA